MCYFNALLRRCRASRRVFVYISHPNESRARVYCGIQSCRRGDFVLSSSQTGFPPPPQLWFAAAAKCQQMSARRPALPDIGANVARLGNSKGSFLKSPLQADLDTVYPATLRLQLCRGDAAVAPFLHRCCDVQSCSLFFHHHTHFSCETNPLLLCSTTSASLFTQLLHSALGVFIILFGCTYSSRHRGRLVRNVRWCKCFLVLAPDCELCFCLLATS